MEPAQIAAVVSAALGVAGFVVAMIARAEANKLQESKAVQVTVAAAGDVVELINAQLLRSAHDITGLLDRVKVIEDKLAVSEGLNASLRMQLGKVTKRVGILEAFIRTLGHEPPPDQEGT